MKEENLIYLNDLRDRLNFIVQSLEICHETMKSLMELYVSSNDMKMNEIIETAHGRYHAVHPLDFCGRGLGYELPVHAGTGVEIRIPGGLDRDAADCRCSGMVHQKAEIGFNPAVSGQPLSPQLSVLGFDWHSPLLCGGKNIKK